MSSIAVQAEGLGKRYWVGARRPSYGTLRDSISTSLAAATRRRERPPRVEAFWALKEVSLEVRHGEALGIIGRNGAGKSTLLKILSRITRPTTGVAYVQGRVGALLEVGTGFHPELTGRENVHLSGAVLGMTKADIRSRFDQIVDFSGIGAYLDTPVKHYSSGMFMRLAFAVAAHLEADTLIVDEVLAVGDAEFQKRCLSKMDSVAREGRTVLFVSHNLAAVENLCNRAVLLDEGEIRSSGAPREVIAAYMRSTIRTSAQVDLARAPGRRPGMSAVLRQVRLLDELGTPTHEVPCGSKLIVELDYEHSSELKRPVFAILIESSQGSVLSHIHSEIMGNLPPRLPSSGTVVCAIDPVFLGPGRFSMTLGCRAGGEQLDLVDQAVSFDVSAADYYGTGRLPDANNGPLLARARWVFKDR